MSPALADRITECAIEFRIGEPSEMLRSLFRWSETQEGHKYWETIAGKFESQEKVIEDSFKKDFHLLREELTQADVQTLLSILRTELVFTTSEKETDKDTAAAYWKDCDKSSQRGIFNFRWFSAFNASHKRMKQREKTLVGLITKLKGLR
jgi:hypothetical protein